MPRSCTICSHEERLEIERALLDNLPYRHIAARFDTSTGALQRHKADHLPEHLAKAHEVEEAADADTLLSRLRDLNRETAAILKEARKEGSKDNELALKAIARVEKQIELEGRLLDVLKDRPQVNILVSAEWVQVRTVMLEALAPYTDARIAVAGRLMELEAGPPGG